MDDLEQRMRDVLVQLALIAQGRTASYNSSGGSEADYTPIAFNRDGNPVPLGRDGDPAGYYAARWDSATDDDERARTYAHARGRLQQMQRGAMGGGGHAAPVESREELDRRIVDKGEGWTPLEAAQYFRTSVTIVRKAREAAGRETEKGRRPRAKGELTGADRTAEIRRLHDDEDIPARQIARALDVSYSTVLRELGTKR